MSVTITQLSVHGADGVPAADEELTAYAELSNDADQTAQVELTFAVDSQDVGTVHAELVAGSSQWAQLPIGQLTAGAHDLHARGAVDDGMSSSETDNGISFEVAAPAPPTATIGGLQIQPHSNVDHPAGEAWTDERIGVRAEITNTGQARLHATVWLSDETGQYGSQEVTLGPGEQQSVHHDFDPLPVGTHTFTVQATTETHNQSVLLGHVQGTLAVSAPTGNYRHCNVQLALRDFRGQPMSGRAVFVQFLAMDGSVAEGAETVEHTTTTSGVLTLPNTMMPARGSMRVMAVSTGQPDAWIEGIVPYHVPDGQTDLQYVAEQFGSEAHVTATDIKGVREQLSAEFGAGVDIEVIKINGKVAATEEVSHQYSTAVSWDVRVGRQSFTFTASN